MSTSPSVILGHDGQALVARRDLFVPSPREIGPVITAHSTLDVGQNQPRQSVGKAVVLGTLGWSALAVVPVTGVIIWLVVPLLRGASVVALGILVSLAVGAAISWLRRPRFGGVVTYVARAGLGSYRCRLSRQNIVSRKAMPFDKAVYFYGSSVRSIVNGSYVGTGFRYYWTDADDTILFEIKGEYQDTKPPDLDSEANGWPEYLFAVRAEEAWTAYLRSQLESQLKASPFVEFRRGTKLRGLRVGKDYVEFFFFDQKERWPLADVADIQFVRTIGAPAELRFKSGRTTQSIPDLDLIRGTCTVAYDEISNAAHLIHLLSHVSNGRFPRPPQR